MDFKVQTLAGMLDGVTGLSSKGAATRSRLVAGAAELMRTAGVAHTTLDDVLAHTGTSKGQLFHYFPGGREALLLAVAELESARVLDDQEPHLSNLTTPEAWRRWRDAVVARYRAQGPNCPLHALMTQISVGTPGSHAVVLELMRSWERSLQTGLEAMQADGAVAADLDAAATARAFVATIQGGVQVLMATGDARHLEAGLDLLLTGIGV